MLMYTRIFIVISKQDRRKKERAEEESRLAEQRSVEEQKRRAEDVSRSLDACGGYFCRW